VWEVNIFLIVLKAIVHALRVCVCVRETESLCVCLCEHALG